MTLGPLTPRPQVLAALVAALFLSAIFFRLMPERPERNVLGRENAITTLREMLARMPTDDVVAVRPRRGITRRRLADDGAQYMDRAEAEREVARALAAAQRMCPPPDEDAFGECHDEHAREIFDRADAQREIARLQDEITSARTRAWGFGALAWVLGLAAVGLAVSLARRGALPMVVDIARGDDPAVALQQRQGLVGLCLACAVAVVGLALMWSQSFVGWMDLFGDHAMSYRALSEKLDESGLGARYTSTVLPIHAVVLGALVQLVRALQRVAAEFRQADPELSLPARVASWAASSGARRMNIQQQLREKQALAHALQTNGASAADVARIGEEIRALEEEAARPPPAVEQTFGELRAALAQKRAELGVLRRNGAPDAAVAAAGAGIVELRGRLVELGEQVGRGG